MVTVASGDAFGILFVFFIVFALGYPVLCSCHSVAHRFLFAYAFVFACGLTVASVAGATLVIVLLWEAATSGKSDHVPVELAVVSLFLMLLATLAWVGCVRAWRKAQFFGAMERKWRNRLRKN